MKEEINKDRKKWTDRDELYFQYGILKGKEEIKERILKEINKIIPKEKPDLCDDGQEGMFSAQDDGIEYGEWKMGQKILKKVKKLVKE